MKSYHGWTKEMIDAIKDCKIKRQFPILIKWQRINYIFTDDKHNILGKELEKSSVSYKGLFGRGRYCMESFGDGYDEQIYKLWQTVNISIHLNSFDTYNDIECLTLNKEKYKYGFLSFSNLDFEGITPILDVVLFKDCGIKETLDDLFLKCKIFNHRDLTMDIDYDCEFVKDIDYDNFLSNETQSNLVPIKSIGLVTNYGLED